MASNTNFEIYAFRQAKQDENETFDMFVKRLRTLANKCKFTDKDKELKFQIIQGCYLNDLRIRALSEEFTTNDLIKLGQIIELTQKLHPTTTAIPASPSPSNKNNLAGNNLCNEILPATTATLASPYLFYDQDNLNKEQAARPQTEQRRCGKCGRKHSPNEFHECPALGKVCRICGKANHFDKFCRNKPAEKPAEKPEINFEDFVITEKVNVEADLISCGQCGRKHVYGKCPAFGKVCRICGKPNHFDKVCRSKPEKAEGDTELKNPSAILNSATSDKPKEHREPRQPKEPKSKNNNGSDNSNAKKENSNAPRTARTKNINKSTSQTSNTETNTAINNITINHHTANTNSKNDVAVAVGVAAASMVESFLSSLAKKASGPIPNSNSSNNLLVRNKRV